MKYVAYYSRSAYALDNVSVPRSAIGTTEIPDGSNIYTHASMAWLADNVVVGDSTGYMSKEAALFAAKQEIYPGYQPETVHEKIIDQVNKDLATGIY